MHHTPEAIDISVPLNGGSQHPDDDDYTPSTAVNPSAPFLFAQERTEESLSYKFRAKEDDNKDAINYDSGHFERPLWRRFALHILTCIFIYPLVVLTCLLANHTSIFWARFIVGLGSGVLGVTCSFNLLEFTKRHLEAVSELSKSMHNRPHLILHPTSLGDNTTQK